MKKKIGIVGWKTGDNSFGTTVPYLNYFSNYGEIIILTPGQEVIKDLDLLVLPGGRDVNTVRYGEAPNYFNSDPNPFLEYFDEMLLPQYIEQGTPIFGICRGFQTLNVHFGGSLIQHYIHGYSTKSRSELIHDLKVINLDEFGIKTNFTRVSTNSIHHQVITHNTLSSELVPTLHVCEAKMDHNVIEGFIHKDLPIAGVQYHPEEIFDDYSDVIINHLLKNDETN